MKAYIASCSMTSVLVCVYRLLAIALFYLQDTYGQTLNICESISMTTTQSRTTIISSDNREFGVLNCFCLLHVLPEDSTHPAISVTNIPRKLQWNLRYTNCSRSIPYVSSVTRGNNCFHEQVVLTECFRSESVNITSVRSILITASRERKYWSFYPFELRISSKGWAEDKPQGWNVTCGKGIKTFTNSYMMTSSNTRIISDSTSSSETTSLNLNGSISNSTTLSLMGTDITTTIIILVGGSVTFILVIIFTACCCRKFVERKTVSDYNVQYMQSIRSNMTNSSHGASHSYEVLPVSLPASPVYANFELEGPSSSSAVPAGFPVKHNPYEFEENHQFAADEPATNLQSNVYELEKNCSPDVYELETNRSRDVYELETNPQSNVYEPETNRSPDVYELETDPQSDIYEFEEISRNSNDHRLDKERPQSNEYELEMENKKSELVDLPAIIYNNETNHNNAVKNSSVQCPNTTKTLENSSVSKADSPKSKMSVASYESID